MSCPKKSDNWWYIVTASGGPLVYGTGNVVLFPSREEAERWMGPDDRSIEPWDGVTPGAPPMPS